MIVLLNTPILTAFGAYEFLPIEIDDAKILVSSGFKSFIGHESTAKILSKIFDIHIVENREEYSQQAGEQALIFKLKNRIVAGTVLKTIQEIEEIGYEFGILKRIK